MHDEFQLLVSQLSDERVIHRKREAFLISVILHLLFLILILIGPKYFPTFQSRHTVPVESEVNRSQDLGFLALPHDYQKLLQKPKTPVISDKDRQAQGKAPQVHKDGLRAPYSEGNTKLPEKSGTKGAPKPQSPPPSHPAVASKPTSPTAGQKGDELPPLAKAEDSQQAKLTLPKSQEPKDSQSAPNLRDLQAGLQMPGASVRGALEQARRSGSLGAGDSGLGDGRHNFDNRFSNFSMDQPAILSDTQGVDFGAWFRLMYYRVRDNWHSVIPELIRSGMQGMVVVVGDIGRDGRILELEVVRSSGISSYDRAALSSLRLSEPFAPFPKEYSGESVKLRWIYRYNVPR